MTETRTLVLIPARMAASRLPGKPLLDIAGLPMIVHVLRRAEAAKIGRVAVATDTAEIAAAVRANGGEAVMTRADHPSGSDRIFEALQTLDPQGKAVMGGLQNLGLSNVNDVRIGKNITLQVEAGTPDQAKQVAEEASKKLLANPVMEYFEIIVN